MKKFENIINEKTKSNGAEDVDFKDENLKITPKDVKESYYNPDKASAIRKSIALAISMVAFAAAKAFGPAMSSMVSVVAIGMLNVLTLSTLSDIIGCVKYKKWKKKHPGPEHNYGEFMSEMKATNGGYTPEDFGRRR